MKMIFFKKYIYYIEKKQSPGGLMWSHVLAQSCKVYLVHEAEVQDPAGKFFLG